MLRFVIILMACLPGIAAAHGVRLSVTAGNDAVVGSASFADGSPMAEAVIELRESTKQDELVTVARSRTHADGRFAVPLPRMPGEFVVVVDDGIGHRAESRLTITVNDSPGDGKNINVSIANPASHDHSHWREWLTGLGYLFGIFGIGSWWLARRGAARRGE